MGTADFVIMGNDQSNVTVSISNVTAKGGVKSCADPPLVTSGICGNACYSANVISDGSYNITCTRSRATVPNGTCSPLMGSVSQRCASRVAVHDEKCQSGLRCGGDVLVE